ncbi:MAG: hypothetical protein KME30_09325 [Iphinoe sp. HA4291-MV1]|jgi:hypothetical protein|nr:hypothetical protein [Iphinoe sp. HA4291-MV1]
MIGVLCDSMGLDQQGDKLTYSLIQELGKSCAQSHLAANPNVTTLAFKLLTENQDITVLALWEKTIWSLEKQTRLR